MSAPRLITLYFKEEEEEEKEEKEEEEKEEEEEEEEEEEDLQRHALKCNVTHSILNTRGT